jgi:hypothetical protein
MVDFDLLRREEVSLADFIDGLTKEDLIDLTNELIDRQLELISGCMDDDVTFVPVDLDANDPYAAKSEDSQIAWTLGHVIVHSTASSEEAAFLAAEMARGVDREGRSRYELPWETVTTVVQCRARLEESRRMRLASLEMWPDDHHLEIVRSYRWVRGPVNAIGRYMMGLWHESEHIGQIEKIIRQAHAQREVGY